MGPYKDFAACVAAQQKKGYSKMSAQKICGAIEANMNKAELLVLTKSSNERRYTLGVVYEPDVVDTQGDFAKAGDIEDAAWAFMERLQVLAKTSGELLAAFRTVEEYPEGVTFDVTALEDLVKGAGLDDEHLQVDEPLGTIVESYIAPQDLTVNGQAVKKGAWLLGVRWTDEMFQKIKAGARTGLSLYGRADSRVEV